MAKEGDAGKQGKERRQLTGFTLVFVTVKTKRLAWTSQTKQGFLKRLGESTQALLNVMKPQNFAPQSGQPSTDCHESNHYMNVSDTTDKIGSADEDVLSFTKIVSPG